MRSCSRAQSRRVVPALFFIHRNSELYLLSFSAIYHLWAHDVTAKPLVRAVPNVDATNSKNLASSLAFEYAPSWCCVGLERQLQRQILNCLRDPLIILDAAAPGVAVQPESVIKVRAIISLLVSLMSKVAAARRRRAPLVRDVQEERR